MKKIGRFKIMKDIYLNEPETRASTLGWNVWPEGQNIALKYGMTRTPLNERGVEDIFSAKAKRVLREVALEFVSADLEAIERGEHPEALDQRRLLN